ncbi:hypothetical protein HYN59_06145 [Flavobacterium album]|uniref:Signal transduction histidine kinase internal region domain-containing protein n=1 Tax=Flavobacterium album TaxID=2175091 RepID=A0A2S1QWE1_9FLAO|nr:tetratricopeptide repeat protein [Flavobacterium album]AWH84727.1 hypothetical protein HYN59_06145 [Flavobacterium album]
MKRCLAICFLMSCLVLFVPQVSMAQANANKANFEAQADSLNQLGNRYLEKKEYPQAETYYKKAIALSRKQKLDEKLGCSLFNLSVLYSRTANYETAIGLGEEAVNILEKYPPGQLLAKCYMTLEVCKKEHGQFLEAMGYADKAVEVLRKVKNDTLLEHALWRAGDLWNGWNTSRAIPMFKESLALAKKLQKYGDIDNIYSSLGFCYSDPFGGDPDKVTAERYFRKGLEAALEYDPADVAINRIYYGKICTANKKYKEAEYHIKIVYAESAKSGDNDMLSTAAFCLSEVYSGMGDFQKAYQFLKEHEALEEKYYADRKKSTVDNMAFNFKTERIRTQNKLLKQQRELQKAKQEQESFRKSVKIWVSVLVALFLVLVTVLLFRYFKKKNMLLSKKSNTLRQQLLLTQMSPHFITSSISSIQTLIRQDKPDVAAAYLSKFARLTRQILENSTGDYIALDEEIVMITNYLAVQQLLHPGSFSFTVDEDDIDSEAIYIPPMLTLPLITNAVERAAKSEVTERSVEVRFLMKNGKLVFEVSNTGGPLEPGERQAILESASVHITVERLANGQPFTDPVKLVNTSKEGVITGVMAWFEIPYVTD